MGIQRFLLLKNLSIITQNSWVAKLKAKQLIRGESFERVTEEHTVLLVELLLRFSSSQ